MSTLSTDELRNQTCKPCEGGVDAIPESEAREQLQQLDGWKLGDDGKSISRTWKTEDFLSGMAFLDRVAKLAEDEGHHPDVHLTGYRNVRIDLTTHAIDGLSENDFIVASKIDAIEVDTKE